MFEYTFVTKGNPKGWLFADGTVQSKVCIYLSFLFMLTVAPTRSLFDLQL